MSIKMSRIEKEMIRTISQIIETEVKDPDIHLVTITACKVTNDLSFAKVYFMSLNDKKEETEKTLNEAAGFIRRELAEKMDLRHTPELTFVYDESIEDGKKIEDIISKIHEEENEK